MDSKKRPFFLAHAKYLKFFLVTLMLVITILPIQMFGNSMADSIDVNELSDIFLEEDDGTFSGSWVSTRLSQSGLMNGTIQFGRSDTIGKIKGVLFDDDLSMFFTVTASIFNNVIFGSLRSEESIQFFFGTINVDIPLYDFSIYSPYSGFIKGNGTFDGSFLPKPNGPYEVGVRSYHLIDNERDEWFTEDDDSDKREFMIKIWYPSEKNSFSDRMDYMDQASFLWLRNQGPVPLITIPKNAYTFVHPFIYQEVSPVRSKLFPVLLFSPGYDGIDSIYTSFINELVSNGYIVVSMNHPYVSGITVFPDGRIVYIAERPGNFSESVDFLKRSQQTVIDDALFTLDFIEQFNQSDEFLSGIFDCSRIGMFGHSFGGAATINCCFLDERVKAGFTLDGVVYDEFITDSIDTPFLLMCAEQRFNHSSYDHIWDQFSTDAYQVGVNGSAHYGYTDVGLLISHLIPLIPSETLGFGTIDPKYLIQVTRLFENAFFDVYLKGAEKEVLTSLFDDFDEVSVRIKKS